MVDNNENLTENVAENNEETPVNDAEETQNVSQENSADDFEYDFDDISQAISAYDYDKATQLINNNFDEKCNDIRIIVYKFFCDMINDHFKNLENHFSDMLDHLNEFTLENLQPQRTIERQSENAFNWFTKLLLKGINDCIKQYNIEYPFREDNKLLEENLKKFNAMMKEKFNFEDKFTGIIEEIVSLVVLDEPEVDEQNPGQGANNSPQSNNQGNSAGNNAENFKNALGANFMHLDPNLMNGDASSTKWLELQNNILIFNDLMKEQRFLEAAVFFKDINQHIINFDPREYFPDIFYQLYQAMTHDFDKVCEIIDNQQHSLEWLVTEQLFRINPEKLAQQGLPGDFSSEQNFHELSAKMQKASVNENNTSLLDIDEAHHSNSGEIPRENLDFEQQEQGMNQANSEADPYTNFENNYDNNLEGEDDPYKEGENGDYDYEN
ncbi:type VI secretion system protein IglI family protein [Lentisphaerota bacterium WC36G]|nr:hypothetical protein LJT99_01225 [Lentisphaerae bacterium WC36]